MSFYSTSDEDQSYKVESRFMGDDGAVAIMAEAVDFEEQITLDMLKSDYLETKAIKESATEEELAAISEGTVADIAKKIKDFFIKLGKRIKDFVLGWIARIRAKLTSDNKAFYNKYKNQVANADDMEVEYRKVANLSAFKGGKDEDTVSYLINQYKINEFKDGADVNAVEEVEIDEDALKDEAASKFFGFKVEFKDLKKNVEEHAYTDSEKTEVKFKEIKNEVTNLLTNGDSALKDIEKMGKHTDDVCKKTAADASKAAKSSRVAQRYSKVCSIYGTVVSKAVGAVASIYKEQLSQARTTFAKAVQYKPKED